MNEEHEEVNVVKSRFGMSSDLAIRAVLNGSRIARSGWNGKGMYVVREDFKNVPAPLAPTLMLVTPHGPPQPGWVFSQADLFATDWIVIRG